MMFITMILFLLLIIGLVKPELVIRWGDKKTRKQVLLYYGIAFLVFGLISNSGVSDQQEVNIVEYHIEEKQDLSFREANRFTWHVIIEEKANPDQLMAVSKEVVEKAKKEENFNALSVMLYDYREFVGSGYTLGKAVYAPDGDWAQAENVNPGDYNKMEYSWDLRKKDWEKQLTPTEVEVWSRWKQTYKEKETESNIPDEEEISKIVAEEFDISKQEVDDILMKKVIWQNQDLDS